MAKGWTPVEKNEPKQPESVAPVLLTMTPEQLQALIAALPQSSPASGLTAEALADILKANRQEAEARRSVRHSNADHPHISAFSLPGGDLKQPKPTFQTPDGRKRETYFNNHLVSEDESTPHEIACFNAIQTTCSARGETWHARIDQDGRRLRVDVPSYTIDDRMNLPSLVEILTELAQGPKAVSTPEMLARIADLERIVREQQAAVVLAS